MDHAWDVAGWTPECAVENAGRPDEEERRTMVDGDSSGANPVLLYRYRDCRGSVQFCTYRPEIDIPGAVLYHFRLISQSPPRWEFRPVTKAGAPPTRRDRRRRARPAYFVRTGPGDDPTWVPAPWPFPAGALVHVRRLVVDEVGDVVELFEPHVPDVLLGATGT